MAEEIKDVEEEICFFTHTHTHTHCTMVVHTDDVRTTYRSHLKQLHSPRHRVPLEDGTNRLSTKNGSTELPFHAE